MLHARKHVLPGSDIPVPALSFLHLIKVKYLSMICNSIQQIAADILVPKINVWHLKLFLPRPFSCWTVVEAAVCCCESVVAAS